MWLINDEIDVISQEIPFEFNRFLINVFLTFYLPFGKSGVGVCQGYVIENSSVRHGRVATFFVSHDLVWDCQVE